LSHNTLLFEPWPSTLPSSQKESRRAAQHPPLDRHRSIHLVVGPTGVYVIDSKRYRGQLRYTGGHLWHGGRTLDRTLQTLWWEATQIAETLGFGPDLHIYPVLCVHVARLPWLGELLVDGVPVLDAAALRPALQVTRQALTAEQVALVADQVRAGFRPAT
jgi:hypothetical protein